MAWKETIYFGKHTLEFDYSVAETHIADDVFYGVWVRGKGVLLDGVELPIDTVIKIPISSIAYIIRVKVEKHDED